MKSKISKSIFRSRWRMEICWDIVFLVNTGLCLYTAKHLNHHTLPFQNIPHNALFDLSDYKNMTRIQISNLFQVWTFYFLKTKQRYFVKLQMGGKLKKSKQNVKPPTYSLFRHYFNHIIKIEIHGGCSKTSNHSYST